MTKTKVLITFGTRPEAIKMAPVIKSLKNTDNIETIVCVTAQHRQMLDQVLDLFKINPDIDLQLMRENQSLAQITTAILTNLDPVIKNISPNWLLVQGDTTTSMTASLLSYYNHIKIGHIEAGLRTGNKWEPFPEEINRHITSLVADLHFAPTQQAKNNLLLESIPPEQIILTGNTVIDALLTVAKLPTPAIIDNLFREIHFLDQSHGQEPLSSHRIVLITAHRRENFGNNLENICRAIIELAKDYQDKVTFIYPVHLNPNVQNTVYPLLDNIPNIILLPPLDYYPMVHLMKHASLILTDSGGIQEEAPTFNIPVLVLRDVTERPEGIQSGVAYLAGTDTENIIRETHRLLDNPLEYNRAAAAPNPYGDGHAAKRIVQAILDKRNNN